MWQIELSLLNGNWQIYLVVKVSFVLITTGYYRRYIAIAAARRLYRTGKR